MTRLSVLLAAGGIFGSVVAGAAASEDLRPAERGSPHQTHQQAVVRFHETVDVVAPALDLKRLREEWTRHWNLRRAPGPPTGVPTHQDMLKVMTGTPRLDRVPESVLVTLAARGIRKLLHRERMPPADSTLDHSVEPPPAE